MRSLRLTGCAAAFLAVAGCGSRRAPGATSAAAV